MSSNTSVLAQSRVRYVLFAVRSVLSEEKKLSIAALSQTLSARLMLQMTPWLARSRWKGSWCTGYPIGVVQHGLGLAPPPDGQHECIGEQCVIMVACMDQPTTRREKRSTTAAT